MLKQPERESRNVNDFFYEMEGRQIQKMNKVLEGVELTKAEARNFDNGLPDGKKVLWIIRYQS